jgi:ribonucleoside-diphosphate reductase alpha chain
VATAQEQAAASTLSESLKVSITPQEQDVFDKQYKRRPQILKGATYKINSPFGMAYITINDMNGTPSEIFLNVGKAGSDVFAMAEALGRVCSLFLRYGDHGNKTRLLIKHLKGIGGSGAIGFGVNRVESIADAVAKALEMHAEGETADDFTETVDVAPIVAATPKSEERITFKSPAIKLLDLCPSCGTASLVSAEGCKTCTNCGYSRCS